MSRIGTHIAGFQLRLVHQLNSLDRSIDANSLRLSTGKRLNSSADDPAAMVAATLFRSELAGIVQAQENVALAQSLVDTADDAYSLAVDNLTAIRDRALAAAGGGLTAEELATYQAEVDAYVEAIENLASDTSFNGRTLLDGSADYTISGQNTSQVSSVLVLQKTSGASSDEIELEVTTAAEQAELTYNGGGGRISKDATITLTGNSGSAEITVTKNEDLEDAAERINLEVASTGVLATVNGNELTLSSVEYGSAASVAVVVDSGEFNVSGGNGDGTADGVDAEATINGESVTAAGLRFFYASSDLTVRLDVQASFGTGTVDTITVSGAGLQFQLGDTAGARGSLSLPSLQPTRLGGSAGTLNEIVSGGGISLFDDPATAYAIAEQALSTATLSQARIGAFSAASLESAASLLASREEHLADSLGAVEDVDEALETARLARNQLLFDNAQAALVIAADQESSILTLLQNLGFN